MNEQTLSPAIEKALSDLRQAIAAEIATHQDSSVSPVAVPSPLSTPATPDSAPLTPPEISSPLTPDMGLQIPTPTEPVGINLPDLSAAPAPVSGNNGLDDSPVRLDIPVTPEVSAAPATPVTAPISEPAATSTIEPVNAPAPTDMSASAPAPTEVSAPAPATDIPAPVNPITAAESPATVEPITPAGDASTAAGGLPKANSLLSNVLKKGWSSSQQ